MRSSTRHHERRYRDKLDEARAVHATETAPTPPDSNSGEPTAASLGLTDSSRTQWCTPEEPNGDRPTWDRAPCTDSAPLTAQRCAQNRTTTVWCTASDFPHAHMTRVGRAWPAHPGRARRVNLSARRELSDFGRTHRPGARAGVGQRGCRRRRSALCAYKRSSAWAAVDPTFPSLPSPNQAWPGFAVVPAAAVAARRFRSCPGGAPAKGASVTMRGARRWATPGSCEPPRRHLPIRPRTPK